MSLVLCVCVVNRLGTVQVLSSLASLIPRHGHPCRARPAAQAWRVETRACVLGQLREPTPPSPREVLPFFAEMFLLLSPFDQRGRMHRNQVWPKLSSTRENEGAVVNGGTADALSRASVCPSVEGEVMEAAL